MLLIKESFIRNALERHYSVATLSPHLVFNDEKAFDGHCRQRLALLAGT